MVKKIIYHSVYLNHIISEEKWDPNPTTTRTLPNFPIPYSYHDYITAWFRFMLHQNETMSIHGLSIFIKTLNLFSPSGSSDGVLSLVQLLKYFLHH